MLNRPPSQRRGTSDSHTYLCVFQSGHLNILPLETAACVDKGLIETLSHVVCQRRLAPFTPLRQALFALLFSFFLSFFLFLFSFLFFFRRQKRDQDTRTTNVLLSDPNYCRVAAGYYTGSGRSAHSKDQSLTRPPLTVPAYLPLSTPPTHPTPPHPYSLLLSLRIKTRPRGVGVFMGGGA